MKVPNWLDKALKVVAGVGAANWLLGVWDFNLVTWLGTMANMANLTTWTYVVIGVAGVYVIADVFKVFD